MTSDTRTYGRPSEAEVDMKLYAVRVFVRDWESACTFYESKLGLTAKFRDDGMGWAEFDVGGPSLAVERVRADDPETEALIGRFVGVSLEVADIYETYDRLVERGVDFLASPQRQPWGGVLAHFRDPEGNVLTLLGK